MSILRRSFILLIGATMVHAQGSQLPKYTVATLPSAVSYPTYTVQVIDGVSSSDCTVGGGLYNVLCTAYSGAWISVGSSYPGVTSPGTGGLEGNAGTGATWELSPGADSLLFYAYGPISYVGTFSMNDSGAYSLENNVGPASLIAAGYRAPSGGAATNCWNTNGSTTACGGASSLVTAAPQFSPASGQSASSFTVTLTDTTPGATIAVCEDQADTCQPDTTYSSPISLSTPGVNYIRAVAAAPGFTSSVLTIWAGTVTSDNPAPLFSPGNGTYTSAVTVTVNANVTLPSGAAVYYTTNGTTPTCSSTPYTAPIPISATTTLEAITCGGSLGNSTVTSAVYTINASAPQTATPVITPTGPVLYGATVTITDATAGASIYYQIGYPEPLPPIYCGSPYAVLYSAPFSYTSQFGFAAIACASGYADSAVAASNFTMTVPAPTFSPASPYANAATTITIADAASGVTILYCSTSPSASPCNPYAGSTYTGPLSFSASENLYAVATTGSDIASSTAVWQGTLMSGGSGTITGVTAGTGLTGGGSSGDVTVSLSTPVSVTNGGSGTSSPSLVAGSNVTITGSWPDQTISASGGGGGLTTQTNGTNNSSQSTLNLINSSTNAAGLTLTETNTTGGTVQGEIAGTANAAHGGTGISTSSSTGVPNVTSGTWAVSTALPNPTTVTTQATGDDSTKAASDQFVYENSSQNNLLTWRSKLQGVVNYSGNAVMCVVGDSLIYGLGCSSSNQPACSMPYDVANIAQQFYGMNATWDSWFGYSYAGFNSPATDSRLSVGSGWAEGTKKSLGVYTVTATSGAGELSFTPTDSVTTFNVYYVTISGGGEMNVWVDSGSPTEVNTSGSTGVGVYTATVSAGTHTVHVQPASGTVDIIGEDARNTALNQVYVEMAGAPGATDTLYYDTSTAYGGGESGIYSAIGCNAVVAEVGSPNDYAQGVTVTEAQTAAQAAITAMKTAGADVVVYDPPPYQGADQLPYSQMAQGLAAANSNTLSPTLPLPIDNVYVAFGNGNMSSGSAIYDRGLVDLTTGHPNLYGYIQNADLVVQSLFAVQNEPLPFDWTPYLVGNSYSQVFPQLCTATHTSSGGTDYYACTLAGVTTYTNPFSFYVKWGTTNAGVADINVNGLGNVTLYKNQGQAGVAAGDLQANGMSLVTWNPTIGDFFLNDEVGTPTNSVTLAQAIYGGTSTGSANAQTITMPVTPANFTYLGAGSFSATFVPGYTNTSTTPTLTVDPTAIGPYTIVKCGQEAVAAGDLVANEMVAHVTWDGTYFELLNPVNGCGSGGGGSPGGSSYAIQYNNGGSFGGASFTGLTYNNGSSSAPSAATATNVSTLLQGLTGCSTSGYVLTPEGNDCVAQSGGSSSFSSLTGGTNTSAAMLVGTGASLAPTGSGTVSANLVNGASVPASAAFVGTNSSSQIVSAASTYASTSQYGISEVDGVSTQAASGVVSEVPSTYWMSPWFGSTAVDVATANHIYGYGFTVPTPVTFSAIYSISNVADSTNLYSLAIVCGSSTCTGGYTSGQIICNPSAGSNIPTADTVWTNTCSEGSTTIYPGNVYILTFTTDAAATGKLFGAAQYAAIGPFNSSSVAGCTSTSGLISGTCTISLSVTQYTQSPPTFYLH